MINKRAADAAAERGDTKKARLSQLSANRNRAKAAENRKAAAVAGSNADDQFAAAKNARQQNKKNSSLD